LSRPGSISTAPSFHGKDEQLLYSYHVFFHIVDWIVSSSFEKDTSSLSSGEHSASVGLGSRISNKGETKTILTLSH
jgi:hypothetical protein